RKEANIIFGWVSDQSMEGQVRVTVLATGFASRPNTMVHAQPTQQAVQQPPPTSRQLETPPAVRQPVAAVTAAPHAQPPSPQSPQPMAPVQPAVRSEAQDEPKSLDEN